MEKRDELSDIRLVGSYSRRASVFAGKGIDECRQSLFECYGVHVCSCLSHVSPTFSYSPKIDKSRTSAKSGSDNIVFFSLYGITSTSCQGGDREGWFREAGLSEPLGVEKSTRVRPTVWPINSSISVIWKHETRATSHAAPGAFPISPVYRKEKKGHFVGCLCLIYSPILQK